MKEIKNTQKKKTKKSEKQKKKMTFFLLNPKNSKEKRKKKKEKTQKKKEKRKEKHPLPSPLHPSPPKKKNEPLRSHSALRASYLYDKMDKACSLLAKVMGPAQEHEQFQRHLCSSLIPDSLQDNSRESCRITVSLRTWSSRIYCGQWRIPPHAGQEWAHFWKRYHHKIETTHRHHDRQRERQSRRKKFYRSDQGSHSELPEWQNPQYWDERIILMSLFIDIEWTKKGNTSGCICDSVQARTCTCGTNIPMNLQDNEIQVRRLKGGVRRQGFRV